MNAMKNLIPGWNEMTNKACEEHCKSNHLHPGIEPCIDAAKEPYTYDNFKCSKCKAPAKDIPNKTKQCR